MSQLPTVTVPSVPAAASNAAAAVNAQMPTFQAPQNYLKQGYGALTSSVQNIYGKLSDASETAYDAGVGAVKKGLSYVPFQNSEIVQKLSAPFAGFSPALGYIVKIVLAIVLLLIVVFLINMAFTYLVGKSIMSFIRREKFEGFETVSNEQAYANRFDY